MKATKVMKGFLHALIAVACTYSVIFGLWKLSILLHVDPLLALFFAVNLAVLIAATVIFSK